MNVTCRVGLFHIHDLSSEHSIWLLLTEYHNHAHISIGSPLNFPDCLYFALFFMMKVDGITVRKEIQDAFKPQLRFG